MLKKLAVIYGLIFIAVGAIGFIRGISEEHVMLFGIFHVDNAHNSVHLLSGIAALSAAFKTSWARLYFRVFGVFYGLIAIIGLLQGTSVFGLFVVNLADNLLHIGLAAISLVIGFGLPKK